MDEFNGVLTEYKKRQLRLVESLKSGQEVEAEAQIGKADPENPMAVAATFFSLVTDEDFASRLMELQSLCTPESVPAWGDFFEVHELLVFPSFAVSEESGLPE